MKKLILFLVLTFTAGGASAQSVQLSTYYPSPFGMYDRIRLVPRIALGEPCDPGTLYVENTGTTLRFCGAAGTWGTFAGVWTQAGNNLYPSDIANPNLKVGIGTTTPDEELHIGQVLGNVVLRLGDFGTSDWDLIRSVGNDSIPAGSFALKMTGAAAPSLVADTVGNIGIGTTTPNNLIQVQGLINFDNSYLSTAMGYQAGNINAANGGTFVGYQAGFSNNIGVGNTYIGSASGQSNTTGNENTAIGYQALNINTTGRTNTATGYKALYSNTVGFENTANGTYALYTNTGGLYNTAIGHYALYANTDGDSNTASGYAALSSNTTGNYNTASGGGALNSNTIGVNNAASGYYALFSNSTGGSNTASGMNALRSNTSGSNNTAIGMAALDSNTSGSDNTAVGASALGLTTGTYNTGIGYQAGDNITTGNSNIIIGSRISAPSATANNQLSIGNLIFGTGLDGTQTTVSTGNIGIGTNAPSARLEVSGGAIKATGGFIVETRTTNPGSPATGQMWLCTDTGDSTPCNGI